MKEALEKQANVKKAMLWQTVEGECADMDANALVNTHDGRKHPCNLPFLPPVSGGSRSGLSTVSTGRCSSRTGSRCSSVYSTRDSSAGSTQSSRTGSTSRGCPRHTKKKGAPSCRSSDLTPANLHFQKSLWDAVSSNDSDDADETPQVEKIETYINKQPSRPLKESRALPSLVGMAWQDPAEAEVDSLHGTHGPGSESFAMLERGHFILPPSDSRPQSRLSDLGDPIFNDHRSTVFDGGFDHLPRDQMASVDKPIDLLEGSKLTCPSRPTARPNSMNQHTGRRKLPPVSLEAAEAAMDECMRDLTPFAYSGHVEDTAAAVALPGVKEAWATPERPQAPPQKGRFTRMACRPQPSSSSAQVELTAFTESTAQAKISL